MPASISRGGCRKSTGRRGGRGEDDDAGKDIYSQKDDNLLVHAVRRRWGLSDVRFVPHTRLILLSHCVRPPASDARNRTLG